MVPSYIGLGPLTVLKALSASHDSPSRLKTCHNSPYQAQHMSWFSLKSISIIYTYENDTNRKHILNMNTIMNLRNSKKHFSLTLLQSYNPRTEASKMKFKPFLVCRGYIYSAIYPWDVSRNRASTLVTLRESNPKYVLNSKKIWRGRCTIPTKHFRKARCVALDQ